MRTIVVATLAVSLAWAQKAPEHGKKYARLLVRNALVVVGDGSPAAGPKDILIENGVITRIASGDAMTRTLQSLTGGASGGRVEVDAEIDARGQYVLPGFINAHAHIQEERGGRPQPVDYCLKLWLACGITTIRDVGSNLKNSLSLREKSERGEVAAPRIFLYPMFRRTDNAENAREQIRAFKAAGADGVKTTGLPRDIFDVMSDEARKQGLPLAHHVGVEETNAWDDIRNGTRSIEHWYGIPDAALPDKVQSFPSNYNYNNETHRFRWGGRLWREANWDLLMKVFDAMIAKNVYWDPTMSIYEASRDSIRAQNQPWFKEYLHPALQGFFDPNPQNHGSYFEGWTSTDEAYWKENYRIWMNALREFERRGGTIGVGDDAGFIYSIYGFGYIRELELHQEAGFHTLKVIQHATANNAKILGKEDRIGRLREGMSGDLIVLNGNPLEDLKILYPGMGGIEWTVKAGIPYHAPTLAAEVRKLVADARAAKAKK
jgi:imidazolonepropionase-like amidohydrolase